MILAVASGKGGTGKTTVSMNLARTVGSKVLLLDCDVEEPNIHLFLKGDTIEKKFVEIAVPEVDEALCDGCGDCGQFCEYNAIVSFGSKPLIFPAMCHGCGGCKMVCPVNAIGEVGRRIGTVEYIQVGKITLVQGCMDVGMAMSPPIIREVKSAIKRDIMAILDAPPGTSCPVIATLSGADFVLLVTEPTPFGLHDLKLSVEMVRELKIPFGVVINRSGSGDDRVNRFCDGEGIPVLAEIPDCMRIAEAYSRGELIVDALPEYRSHFKALLDSIIKTNNDREI